MEAEQEYVGQEEQTLHAEQDSASPVTRMAKPVIQVRGLRKEYRLADDTVVALKRIDLDIMQGEICCIFGTSGSGKSTLLNQLAGLEKPTRGCVYIGGAPISRMSENQLASFRQKYLGFIFQAYNLLPALTATENVALPLAFRGMPRRKREAIARKMLARVGLGSRADHFPNQMSGGQQQRVGIARAFVTRPRVMFADEPTGNLDSKTTAEVMQMICGFARAHGQTIVLVTHDPNMAAYADRIVTLIDGLIVSDERVTRPETNSPETPPPVNTAVEATPAMLKSQNLLLETAPDTGGSTITALQDAVPEE